MTNEDKKVSETFLKVATILSCLMKKPMDYNEVFRFCLDSNVDNFLSKESFNKYINTLRALGLTIEKLPDEKYHLFNFFVQVQLNKEEIDAFKKFETAILKYGTDNNIKTLISLKTKFFRYFDIESQSFLNELLEQALNTKIGLLVKQFEKICNDSQKIVIEYEGKILTVEPKTISSYNNIIYLDCIDLKSFKSKKLILKRIHLIKQLPNKNSFSSIYNSVVYELSDRLAYNYKLKNNEQVVSKYGKKLVIKCENEDYEFLAGRLARYQTFCKILQPIEFKEYFKNYIDKIAKLYENEDFSIYDF